MVSTQYVDMLLVLDYGHKREGVRDPRITVHEHAGGPVVIEWRGVGLSALDGVSRFFLGDDSQVFISWAVDRTIDAPEETADGIRFYAAVRKGS